MNFVSMLQLNVCSFIAATSKTVKVRRSTSPVDLKNDEAVRMSMFPSGKPPLPNELVKIEREDWPGPPSLAAILPEISEYSLLLSLPLTHIHTHAYNFVPLFGCHFTNIISVFCISAQKINIKN